jgi:hypothetical protein
MKKLFFLLLIIFLVNIVSVQAANLKLEITLDNAEQAMFLQWSPNTEMCGEALCFTNEEWIIEKSKRYFYRGMKNKEEETEKAKVTYDSVINENLKKATVALP